jgi:hypothetical protein
MTEPHRSMPAPAARGSSGLHLKRATRPVAVSQPVDTPSTGRQALGVRVFDLLGNVRRDDHVKDVPTPSKVFKAKAVNSVDLKRGGVRISTI